MAKTDRRYINGVAYSPTHIVLKNNMWYAIWATNHLVKRSTIIERLGGIDFDTAKTLFPHADVVRHGNISNEISRLISIAEGLAFFEEKPSCAL